MSGEGLGCSFGFAGFGVSVWRFVVRESVSLTIFSLVFHFYSLPGSLDPYVYAFRSPIIEVRGL